MISLLQAIILGIVQGITEWLPVSSSGHLVIFQEWMGLSAPLIFDIFLHVGTLIVILLVFWKDIIEILKSLFRLDFKSHYGKLLLFIIIGSIPTALIGYYFNDAFTGFFQNLTVVGIALLVTGCLLFFSERFEKQKGLNAIDSILIGIVQGLAIIPGISRSGSTISVGLLRGVDKKLVAKFSFLLSVPAVIGATILEYDAAAVSVNFMPIIVGTAVSVIVGYLSLRWLLRLIIQKKFHYFSYYCFVVGIVLLVLA
ncbi:undecaprenyl-diphosphate phosphatase [Candidatus Woesearchaeota archaeon]|nr:undecaprenyl-diphosphate phosphatase [Candidatus Woesearchaeota archaeon]MBW3021759.1 undecaprenyl-diphosphate phosphatase [Candidatus Woesearchaeota archaeon]